MNDYQKNPDCSNAKFVDAQSTAILPEALKKLQQEKPAVITSTKQKPHQNKNQKLQQRILFQHKCEDERVQSRNSFAF